MVGPGSVLAEVVGLSGLAGVGVLEWAQWAQWTQWAGSDVRRWELPRLWQERCVDR
jgi:hypothetical protein